MKSQELSGKESETSIHLAVMQWVRLHPKIVPYVIHIPNEGKRSQRFGRQLKNMGMRPGVSDLFVALAKHDYHGAWIELKTPKGRVQESQEIFLSDMKAAGYYTSITRGFDETINLLQWYCGI